MLFALLRHKATGHKRQTHQGSWKHTRNNLSKAFQHLLEGLTTNDSTLKTELISDLNYDSGTIVQDQLQKLFAILNSCCRIDGDIVRHSSLMRYVHISRGL